MANYTTNLKLWGSTGQEYPDGYSYEEGEQPVDEWDNFFQYNAQQDIDHLIQLTNDRIETDSGTASGFPTSPESSHIYYDEENETLHYYDSAAGVWREVVRLTDFDSHTSNSSAHHTRYTDSEARTAVDGSSVSVSSATDATNVTSTYKGNDIDSNGDGVVNKADDSNNLGGSPPSAYETPSSTQTTKTDGGYGFATGAEENAGNGSETANRPVGMVGDGIQVYLESPNSNHGTGYARAYMVDGTVHQMTEDLNTASVWSDSISFAEGVIEMVELEASGTLSGTTGDGTEAHVLMTATHDHLI